MLMSGVRILVYTGRTMNRLFSSIRVWK